MNNKFDSNTDFRDILNKTRKIERYDSFTQASNEAIQIGFVKLSIQASSYHYSSPRKDFQDVRRYSEFEVALLTEDGKFISRDHWLLDHLPVRLKESLQCDDVAAGVTVEEVQRIFRFLLRLEHNGTI